MDKNLEETNYAYIDTAFGRTNLHRYFNETEFYPENYTLSAMEYLLRMAKPAERERVKREYFDSEGRLKAQYW